MPSPAATSCVAVDLIATFPSSRRRPAADRGVLEVVARVAARGGELDPAQRGVGPLRTALPGRPGEMGQRAKAARGPRLRQRSITVLPGEGLGRASAGGSSGGAVRKASAARSCDSVGLALVSQAIKLPDRGPACQSAGMSPIRATSPRARSATNGWFIAKSACCGTVVSLRCGDVQVGVREVECPQRAR